jgi:hypothetical protein
VTVTGIGLDGRRTPGLNMLPFSTPATATLWLSQAKATGQTTGSATATESSHVFSKVTAFQLSTCPSLERLRSFDTCLCMSPWTYLTGALYTLCWVQYLFIVTKSACKAPPCPVLKFPSNSLTASLTGLQPSTQVSSCRPMCSRQEDLMDDKWCVMSAR